MTKRKKILNWAVASSIALFSGCRSSSNFDSSVSKEDFKIYQSYEPKDEMDIAFFIDYNFERISDGSFLCFNLDKWQSPKVTVSRKGGDCDDFAILACDMAEKLGYKPRVLFLSSLFGRGHMLALLHDEQEGKYGVLGKGVYIEPAYDSIDSLVLEGINPNSDHTFTYYRIIYPDKINKNWRTTTQDLTQRINPFSLKKVRRNH